MTPSTQPHIDGSSKPVGLGLVITFVTGGIIGAALFWIAGDLWGRPGQLEVPMISMQKHSNTGANKAKQESGAHSHGNLAVDEWALKPTIISEIHEDPVGGWNLNLQTTNFTFNAAAAGLENKQGEGHAHVYINGMKLARIYGDWFHLGALPHGHNIILVTLNANDHSSLIHKGKKIQHELMMMVK